MMMKMTLLMIVLGMLCVQSLALNAKHKKQEFWHEHKDINTRSLKLPARDNHGGGDDAPHTIDEVYELLEAHHAAVVALVTALNEHHLIAKVDRLDDAVKELYDMLIKPQRGESSYTSLIDTTYDPSGDDDDDDSSSSTWISQPG